MILRGNMAKNRISRVIGGIQRMKKIVASILTAIMLMGAFQTAAFAAEGAEASVSPNPGGGDIIYLDQQHGADDNDGLTETTAVKTIQKANERAESRHIKDICFTSLYKVTGTEVWDLGGKTVHRGTAGYMIELGDASASLTLGNVVMPQCGGRPKLRQRRIRSLRRRTAVPSC